MTSQFKSGPQAGINELRVQYLYKEKGYAKYENTCMTSFKLSA